MLPSREYGRAQSLAWGLVAPASSNRARTNASAGRSNVPPSLTRPWLVTTPACQANPGPAVVQTLPTRSVVSCWRHRRPRRPWAGVVPPRSLLVNAVAPRRRRTGCPGPARSAVRRCAGAEQCRGSPARIGPTARCPRARRRCRRRSARVRAHTGRQGWQQATYRGRTEAVRRPRGVMGNRPLPPGRTVAARQPHGRISEEFNPLQ
ncbi:hypothetical protein SAMN05660473_00529 [Arthrobacter sp. 49Tsu3.1M3]|nr:hypothetical protein SAMN05660473_00529 [Arthrobacter sp. 49Tsu3.1M3]